MPKKVTFRKTAKGNWMTSDGVIVSQEAAQELGLQLKAVVKRSTFTATDGSTMNYFGVFAEIDDSGIAVLKKVSKLEESAALL